MRKTISVVFGDLVGSTALQETLDPESTRRVMARFYDVVRGAVAEHAGEIHKFVGDGVLAIFGTPVVREDDALRAVRCAAAMIAGLEALGDELERNVGVRLRMRVGVNTGELVVSGDGELVGDAMNTAARFEQAAAPGEVLISESTRRLVRDHVELEELPPLALKGKAAPVRAWRVRATIGAETVRAEALLVGRSRELARLRAGLEDAIAARACRLVTVIGSPGIGKSRLLTEFASVVRDEAAVLVGHCEPSGEGITFLPIADVLRQVAGIAEADPPESVRDKLLATIEGDPDAERIAERSAAILGVGKVASPEETFWALRRGLESLARRRPVVVVLDDVHWAQPMLLDLVEHLVEWVTDAPVLLVALARPELREAREALTATPGRPLDVIELSPFDSAESLAFVAGLLGDAELPDALRRRILETTEGNPLFLGELVRMLVDDGFLLRDQGRWVTTAAPDEVEVPPTIQALLAARIERLDADERSVIERAAVIGKQFYRGAVAELVTAPVATVIDAHLEMLRRKEMVEPEGTYWIDEPVFRFHHVLIRDAAYRALLKEARSELHERFARWLQEKAGELVGEHEEVIAFHLEQAHEYRRVLGQLDDRGRALGTEASARLASAGRRALARDDLAAAANLLERALRRLDDGDETERAEVLLDLGEALLSAGDTAGAEQRVAELRGLADSDARLSARADVLDGQIATLTGGADIDATIELVRAAADTLRDAGDRAGEAKAHQVLAQAQVLLGQVAAVEESLDRALAAARASDDRRRVTAILAAAPRAALWGPSPVVRASGRCLDVVRILRMTPGNRHVEAIALRCQAVLEAMRGRTQAARDILAAGRATLEELGLTLELQETAVHAGVVELLAGDPVAAESHLRAAVDGFTALGVDRGAAQASALLARSLVDQHRHDEAVAATEDAERRGGGDLKTSITWRGVRAEALARSGRIGEALALAQRAVDLADPTDALPDKADAWMALATVHVLGGQERDARAAATIARELYAAKDHGVGVLRATTIAGGGAAGDEATIPAHAAEPRAPARNLRAPERILAGWTRLFAAGDADAVLALAAPDSVMRDRRTLGYTGLVSGIQEHSELVRSMIAAAEDLRFEVDEVLACDDRVVAVRTTFHGHGRHAGAFEIPTGLIIVTEDDRWSLTEIFDHDDRDAMLTRFAELRGAGAPIADPELAAFYARFAELWAQRDVAAIADAYPEDLLGVDHRRAGWGDVRGRAGVERQVRSVLDISSDIRFCVDEVFAARDGVVALRVAWRGRSADTGGELESALGWVARVEGQRMTSLDFYEPDDREAMLARFAELTGAMLPPERFFRDISGGNVRLHLGELSEVYTDDFVMVDHRAIGWEETHGHEGLQRAIGAVEETWPDLSATVDEVLACDDRVIAFHWTWCGHANDDSGGGEMQLPIGVVAVVDDGRWASTDFFDPDDRASMLARYAELGGGAGPLADRRPEQVVKAFIRAFAAGDLDGMASLVADDWVLRDHRSLGWEEHRGREGFAKLMRSALGATRNPRLEVDEVLACDDRVIAFSATFVGSNVDGGGPFRWPIGFVIHRTGMDLFDPDDRAAMLARFADLGGGGSLLGDRRPEQVVKAFLRAYAARDVDGVIRGVDDDWVIRDHRRLGWEEMRGRDGAARFMESIYSVTDSWGEVDEVVACSDRVIAVRCTFHHTPLDGGGAASAHFGLIFGRHGVDVFEPDDRDAMLARYAELTAQPREPERMLARMCAAYAARDADALLALWAPTIEQRFFVDHRAIGHEPPRDRTELGRYLRSIVATPGELELVVDEVLACDDHVVAASSRFVGRGVGAGDFEIPLGGVWRVEDGLATACEMFEADDRAGMIAAYGRLGGGTGVLGDRPPERLMAEYVRAFDAHDVGRALEFFADDWVMVDHRPLPWEELGGKEGASRLLRSGFAGSDDMRLEVDEVLACDDDVIALRIHHYGTDERGGAFDLAAGWVMRFEGGAVVTNDLYAPEDREAMLARFAELTGDRGRPRTAASDDAYNRRDLDAMAATYAQDIVLIDHRSLGWERIEGRAAVLEQTASMWRHMSDDIRVVSQEMLARDWRAFARVLSFRGLARDGGGELELALGQVGVRSGDLIERLEWFEPDDRQAMIARYAELGGGQEPLGDSAPERLVAEWMRRYAARDVEDILALYHEDWVAVDRRTIAGEPADLATEQENLRLQFALPLIYMEIEEVLAVAERAAALRCAAHGRSMPADGGGPFEFRFASIVNVEDGRFRRFELFEPEDRAAVLARFAELTGERI